MPRPPHATRTRLLEAALETFVEKGFEGASIREITRRVGIRESGFYAHFASKRDAYDELKSEGGPAVALRAIAGLASDSPYEFLSALMHAVIVAWSAPRARKFLTIALRDAFVGDADGWRTILSGADDALAALTPRFETWQAEGKIISDVTAAQLAYLFMAPIATARIMFFNSAAGPQEATRGLRLLEDHVSAFVLLTRNRT